MRRGAIAGAALALAASASPAAAAHVFLRQGTQPAFSDAPVELWLHYADSCGSPAPVFFDQVHFQALAPTPEGVIVVPFGVPKGIGCTEFNPTTNSSVSTQLGPLAAGQYRVEVRYTDFSDTVVAYTTFTVYDRPPCVSSVGELCLHGGRFGARASWQDFAGGEGAGHSVPRDPAVPFLADTGFLWFFRPDNYELMVKVLDGCALNGHYWVFVSPGSTVEYTIEVTDHATGARQTYGNALGAVPSLVADTTAFPCG